MQAMAWCTDVVAAYLPHIGHAHFKKIVRQLLFLEEVEVIYIRPGINILYSCQCFPCLIVFLLIIEV